MHGEGSSYLGRPGGTQAKTFSTRRLLPPVRLDLHRRRPTLTAINPADVPDELNQSPARFGAPIFKDKTFFFVTADYTRQDRTTFLSSTLPAFVLPADGSLTYVGHYRQELVNARVDHKLIADADADVPVRTSIGSSTTQPERRRRRRPNAPTVARRYTRRSWTTAGQPHDGAQLQPAERSATSPTCNGDPVTLWEAAGALDDVHARGSVPFTIGRVALVRPLRPPVAVRRHAVVVARQHNAALRRQPGSSHVRRHRQRARPGGARHVHVPHATTAPFDQLTLADVQQYTQPISYGITSYELKQWMSVAFVQDSIRRARRSHPRRSAFATTGQTLTDATTNFAPRVGFGWHPNGDSRLAIRGGYGMYYTQIRANAIASCADRRTRRHRRPTPRRPDSPASRPA